MKGLLTDSKILNPVTWRERLQNEIIPQLVRPGQVDTKQKTTLYTEQYSYLEKDQIDLSVRQIGNITPMKAATVKASISLACYATVFSWFFPHAFIADSTYQFQRNAKHTEVVSSLFSLRT